MDMTESLAAKSDQLNAVDLTEPRTFTIEKVTAGSADQPFNFHLVGLPVPYRPSKGMRRVMARGWGAKNVETTYPGRRLTLFCELEVKWAGAPVGGIRISHMSDIGDGFTIPLAESQKKRGLYRVDPLPDAPTQQPSTPSPVTTLLAQIKDAADAAQVDIATIAQEWADMHDGQAIREATDVGSLELIRDDLHAKVATPAPTDGPSA